jgi:hypothetical protein
VTKRLRDEGVRLALVAVQARNREAYEMHRKGANEVSGTLAAWTDEMVREIRDLLPEGKAATDEHNATVQRAHAEGRAAGLREAAKASREAYDWFAKSKCDLYAAGASKCVEAIEALLTKGGGA